MKLGYASDFHHEWGGQRPILLTEPVDVLVLAGDVDKGAKLIARAAEYLDQGADQVVCVAGNHEHWGGELNRTIEKIREAASGHDRVHYLERDVVDLHGHRFIGATGWTNYREGGSNPMLNMLAARGSMNDYKKIKYKMANGAYRRLLPEDLLTHNDRARRFIFEDVDHQTLPCVVVTHHAPTGLSIPDRLQGDPLNPCYANDWGEAMSWLRNVRMWIHGHIHDPSDYQVGDVRVVCNPIGYPGYDDASEILYAQL